MSGDSQAVTPQTFTEADLALISEALDSHLYWQVCQDLTRRSDGFVMEPLTEEEQAVADLAERVDAIAIGLQC